MQIHYHAVTTPINTSRLFSLPKRNAITVVMNESELRRLALRRLVDRFGRGGIAYVAKELCISPTYVSRLLSDPASSQHRSITGDMVLAISKVFPDWLAPNDLMDVSPAVQSLVDTATRLAQQGKLPDEQAKLFEQLLLSQEKKQ